MNVTTEYLFISGLKIPKYIEKLRLFNIIMKIPNGVLSAAPPDVATLLTIRYMIPMKLIATPMDFFQVMGSLMAMAATAIVYIGAMAVSMEQSIGVMYGIPTRKVI